jgi:hypothetical protein
MQALVGKSLLVGTSRELEETKGILNASVGFKDTYRIHLDGNL